jgi:hypothetical protein
MWARWTGVVVLAMTLVACGSAEDVSLDAGTTTTGDGERVAWCEDIEPPGPVAEGNLAGMENGDERVEAAVSVYVLDHAETYGGRWHDREHGGTLVVAFTDDPAEHREAILALPLVAGAAIEGAGVTMGPSTSELTPTSIDPDATVASSGMVVDVVQVAHTQAELEAVQDEVMPALDGTGIEVHGVGSGGSRNRVEIDVAEPDDEARRIVAEHLPADVVCLSGKGWAPPPTIDPATPPTLIPPEGSDPMVSCGGDRAVPAAALDAPLGFEESSHPVAVVLRETLVDSPEVALWPDESWRLLYEDGETAIVVGGDPPSMSMTFEWTGDRWIWSGSGGGECQPVVAVPEGLGEATWSLDPSHPPPAATDTELHLLVNEVACTGSTPIGDRLVGPEVRETEDAVLVAVAVVPLPEGFYDCPGNPSLAVTVELEMPLGDRTLTDGAGNPPGEGS